jgi:hypothetical protein
VFTIPVQISRPFESAESSRCLSYDADDEWRDTAFTVTSAKKISVSSFQKCVEYTTLKKALYNIGGHQRHRCLLQLPATVVWQGQVQHCCNRSAYWRIVWNVPIDGSHDQREREMQGLTGRGRVSHSGVSSSFGRENMGIDEVVHCS